MWLMTPHGGLATASGLGAAAQRKVSDESSGMVVFIAASHQHFSSTSSQASRP
jgi:hypothetical protein